MIIVAWRSQHWVLMARSRKLLLQVLLRIINVTFITISAMYLKLMLLFLNSFANVRACIVWLRYPASVRVATHSCGSTTAGCITISRPSPARCSWSLVSTSYCILECHIILLLNVRTIILIYNLYLYVDTPGSYLLICIVSRRFIFRYDYVLWEIQVLIISLNHILSRWVFETISLSLI